MLNFELLEHNVNFQDGEPQFTLFRTKVPGGWLVVMRRYSYSKEMDHSYGLGYGGTTFVPDKDHRWDGGSIN